MVKSTMVKSTFMQRELEELRASIEEKKEATKHVNSQNTYGYHVDPTTGKLVNNQPKHRVVKTIRVKKSKSLNNPVTLGKERKNGRTKED